MAIKKPTSICAAICLLPVFLLQSCAASAPLESQASSIRPAATAMTTPLHTLPLTASPAVIPIPATSGPVTTTTPSATPESPYVVNEFTASDGKVIYYCGDDGIHCMNLDGSDDRRISKEWFELVALDESGLYYIVYDDEYLPTEKEENEWANIFVPAFNLMFYEIKTEKTHTIRKHLYEVVAGCGWIYMIDHMDHSILLAYDMTQRVTKKVAGYPGDADSLPQIEIDRGRVFVDMEQEYLLSGDTIDTQVTIDDFIEEGTEEIERIKYDYGSTYILTDSGYKLIAADYFDMIVLYKSEYYALKTTMDDDCDDESTCVRASIFKISFDGTYTKLHEEKCVYGYAGSFTTTEFINGWFFSFWMADEGITATRLAMKYRVE